MAPGVVFSVADVVDIDISARVTVVVDAPPIYPLNSISQSPGVMAIEVMLAAAFAVRLTAEPLATDELTNSPILPAAALSLVVVPGYWPASSAVPATDKPPPRVSVQPVTAALNVVLAVSPTALICADVLVMILILLLATNPALLLVQIICEIGA